MPITDSSVCANGSAHRNQPCRHHRQGWNSCSFDEFCEKLLSEAEHRPEEYRLGQYIVNHTSELFPDVVGGLKNDCFGDDQQIEAYLHELFNRLKE